MAIKTQEKRVTLGQIINCYVTIDHRPSTITDEKSTGPLIIDKDEGDCTY